jgi:hypothetical protein
MLVFLFIRSVERQRRRGESEAAESLSPILAMTPRPGPQR